MAKRVVSYTENTLGFHPAYWEIGNEPQLWRQYNYSWKQWPTQNATLPVNKTTPMGYALLVRNYTIAMRAADPTIRIIGLPAAGRPDPYPVEDWVAPVVAIDGPNITGIAYHDYPAGKTVTTLQNFYAAINGSQGLNGRMAEIRGGISNGTNESLYPNTACSAACAGRLSIFVTEFGTVLSHRKGGHWGAQFSGALDYAAQVTQAIALNVSNLDVFASVFDTNNSWLTLTGTVRPSFTLFSEVLSHIGNDAFRASLRTPTQYDGNSTSLGGNLYAVATVDTNHADRADLMVVNLNATTNVTFSPRLPLIGGGTLRPSTPTEVWEWQGIVSNLSKGTNATVNPMTVAPVTQYFPFGLPVNWTLPLQTVALFEAYPGGGVPVQFDATGFAGSYSCPRWYVDVAGTLQTANNTNNLTFFLPDGSAQDPRTFSVSAPSIPLKDGFPFSANNSAQYVKERLEPFLPGLINVGVDPLTVNVSYAHQWSTSIVATTNNSASSPGVVGYVSPAPQWWNASSSLALTARPAFHYVFTRWEGFGNGSSNSTDPWTTLVPTGAITEKAIFTWAYPATFSEVGLPPGTGWSVIVRSHFDVANTTVTTNDSVSSLTTTLGFEVPNGTYGFNIGNVPGYRANLTNSSYLTNSSFSVSGRPTTVEIAFTADTPPAPRYAVTFAESGLPPGTRWWLTTRNVTIPEGGNASRVVISPLMESTDTPALVFEETNGSYGYNTSSIPGFRAHPPAFGYDVAGPGLVIPIQFSPVRYNVVWTESGLGPNLSWSVIVNGNMTPSAGAWTTARLANGTYSFVIPNVADYVPVLRSGGFTVIGAGIMFNVSFPQANYSVTFEVSQLPATDPGQIRFSNSTEPIDALIATFHEPNGSYTFDVQPPAGYLAYPSHGTIVVDAAAMVIPISLVPTGPPSSPPIWNLALPALLASGVIALVGLGTLLIGRSRKRRRSGGDP
jgi:hypothetical protein